ncbi:transposase [Thermoanaerobacterium thermosaccharolyticum]|uniref:transposase n=1 Tax=Thermoanaerobacterium thermosaccharolyticum TaxID=1517 RepID=UPI003D2A52BF
MAFVLNESQQITMDDRFLNLDERTKKFVLNSWAKDFAEIIFPAINERRFSVLYSDNAASRPNSPVNAIIGSLILKEMFNLTDDELLASILCDVRFQYALHTTSFKSQPFSDRTFSRFRERLYLYYLETGRDLLHEEMEAMANVFVKYFDINPSVKRMDSIMVSSSCKKMSRLEILYTCVANMVKAVYKTGEYQNLKNMEHYLDEEDRNKTIYHRKNEEISKRLQEIIDDASILIKELGEAYFELPEYQLLQRVLKEQTETTAEGKLTPVGKEKISPDSLQNPSDPDATYRKKAGKDNKGYVGNLVETVDKKGSIITNYDYDVNTHSDSSFCKETIEKLGKQEKAITIIADGAYGSLENIELAAKNNINLITTALIGKVPDVIQSEFELNETTHEVVKCPRGEKPYKTRYYEKSGLYRASFNKKTCEHCPLREKCGAKLQKKSAYVLITAKTIQRASYLKKMSSEEYSTLQKIRNGVEGIPSILRRRYHVDTMPVRGLVRSKIWFSFKIGAINAKKVLKMAAEMAATLYNKIKFNFAFTKTGKYRVELLLAA